MPFLRANSLPSVECWVGWPLSMPHSGGVPRTQRRVRNRIEVTQKRGRQGAFCTTTPWFHDGVVAWYHGVISPSLWNPDRMVSWYGGGVVARYDGITISWYHARIGKSYLSTPIAGGLWLCVLHRKEGSLAATCAASNRKTGRIRREGGGGLPRASFARPVAVDRGAEHSARSG